MLRFRGVERSAGFSGLPFGNVVHADLQPDANFDAMNSQAMPMGGFNFSGFSGLMLGQMIQFASFAGLPSDTPPQVNFNQLRLMSTWATGTVSQVVCQTDCMFTPTNGIFPATHPVPVPRAKSRSATQPAIRMVENNGPDWNRG